MAEKTSGDVVQEAAKASREAYRQANNIVVDEKESAKPKDKKIVDLPTGERSHDG